MFFCYKLILCFYFVIFVNAAANQTEGDINPTVTNPTESGEPEQLPKQEPFTWLLPDFIRKHLPFGSPEEEFEPHPQERRRFDQDIDRRKHPYLRTPKSPEISRRKYEEEIGRTLSRKHPGRVPSLRPRENSYQRYRPNIRQRIPEDLVDNDAQESSLNAVIDDRDNNDHGSLGAALKSLWEYKQKAYRNLLAKSEAYEKLAGKEDESKWAVESPSSEWPQEFPRQSQADRRNLLDRGVLLNSNKINELSRAPGITSDELPRIPLPPRRNLEQISEIPLRNHMLRANLEKFQDPPPRIKPSRRIPENPRRIRISNTRRPPDSGDEPQFVRRERFPEDISPNSREAYPPPRRRIPLPNRESLARNSNVDRIAYSDDFIDDQSPMSKSESSGRWPRSMQLVRPRDPKPSTDDHKNYLDDDSYFYDLTILDDEGLDNLNEDYAYVATEVDDVNKQAKSVMSVVPVYDLTQAPDDDLKEGDEDKVDDGILMDDYYSVKMNEPSHSIHGIHDINSNSEIEYVDMYEEDFKKLIEEESDDYELEEVVIPANAYEEDQMSYSDFYHRQGAVRIPGSVAPQPQKTIRMKINPGKNSGKKVIKMKIRGLEDSNLQSPIGEQQLPQQSLQQTPNDNRQFNNKPESPKSSSALKQGGNVVKSSQKPGGSGTKYPAPMPVNTTPRLPVNVGTTPKSKGYPYPSGHSSSNYRPPGKGGKKPNFFDFGKPKPGKNRPSGTYSGGKKPIFSVYGGIKPGGSMYGAGGFNEAGIKNALTSTFQQASGVIPDLSKAITVMSFLAFSVFVANLGVNAIANSSLGISFGRENDSPWSLNKSPFVIEDMIKNLDQLLEGSEEDPKAAVDSFEAVVDIAENVYNEFHENIRVEVGNLSEKITNYLDNNFSEEGLPLGDISKKYLLIEGEKTKNDLNINCYRRLLCLSHQLTLKHNISDPRNKMLPFWTFGIGWLKGGQEHVATLLENLRAELAGQSGRNCYSLYSDCENSIAVENYVKETEQQLKNLTKEKTKWEPISSSTERQEQNLKTLPENDLSKQNFKVKNSNNEDKTVEKFKVINKSTVARVTIQKSNK